MVSRSPSQIELTFEKRASKTVKVKPDVEGAPAEGYRLGQVSVAPPRVRIAGARSEVLRISEVATETIDVAGATEPVEREVRVSAGPGHVWADSPQTVKVTVAVEAIPVPVAPIPPPANDEPEPKPPKQPKQSNEPKQPKKSGRS